MNRLNHNTVELTEVEQKASAQFEEFLDRGFTIAEAIASLRLLSVKEGRLSEEFYTYLAS